MNINLFAELKDRRLEKEYFIDAMKNSKRYLSLMTIGLAVLLTIFFIPDYYNISDQAQLLSSTVKRMMLLALLLVFAVWIRHVKDHSLMAYWVLLHELIFTALYFNLSFPCHYANYYMKTFDTLIVIMGIYMIPNKWRYEVLAASVFALAHFIVSFYQFPALTIFERAVGVLYVCIVLLFGAVASFRYNYYQRQHYLDNEELKMLAETDALTGVFNRGRFDRELHCGIEMFRENRIPYSIILFDFDNFKFFNDEYGHVEGDKILIKTIEIVRSRLRCADIISRWGGDEFAILLPNTTREVGIKIAQDLREKIAAYDFGKNKRFSCSFGVGSVEENDTVEKVIAKVDKLLYQAKNEGRNKVTF